MNYPRFAAALCASLLLVGCDRPDRDSDRTERAERAARSERESRAERREREDDDKYSKYSSKVEEQTREVEDFDSIELRGAAELVIAVGPVASLNLSGSERTLKRVETRVRGETLIIDVTKSRGWFSNQGNLKLTITTPTLKSLESNGAGDIEITGLNGGEQKVELAGAHNLKAEGRLDKLTLKLSGAGNVDFKKVIVGEARVTVNGAGNVEVHTTHALRAEVNGVGAVTYSGDPQKVESELHGLGSISRRDNWDEDDKNDADKESAAEKPVEKTSDGDNVVRDAAETQKRE